MPNKNIKVTPEIVAMAKNLHEGGVKLSQIAKIFKLSDATVFRLRDAGFDLEKYREAQRRWTRDYEAKKKAKREATKLTAVVAQVPQIKVEKDELLEKIKSIEVVLKSMDTSLQALGSAVVDVLNVQKALLQNEMEKARIAKERAESRKFFR